MNVFVWCWELSCLAVDWSDVEFISDVQAACCKADITACPPGTGKSCPSQRCVITNQPTMSPTYGCATIETGDIGSGMFGTVTYFEEVEYIAHTDHVEVAAGVNGNSGLREGTDQPCVRTGPCGCGNPAEDNDPDQTPFCSSPENLADGPLEIKIRPVDPNSPTCGGE